MPFPSAPPKQAINGLSLANAEMLKLMRDVTIPSKRYRGGDETEFFHGDDRTRMRLLQRWES